MPVSECTNHEQRACIELVEIRGFFIYKEEEKMGDSTIIITRWRAADKKADWDQGQKNSPASEVVNTAWAGCDVWIKIDKKDYKVTKGTANDRKFGTHRRNLQKDLAQIASSEGINIRDLETILDQFLKAAESSKIYSKDALFKLINSKGGLNVVILAKLAAKGPTGNALIATYLKAIGKADNVDVLTENGEKAKAAAEIAVKNLLARATEARKKKLESVPAKPEPIGSGSKSLSPPAADANGYRKVKKHGFTFRYKDTDFNERFDINNKAERESLEILRADGSKIDIKYITREALELFDKDAKLKAGKDDDTPGQVTDDEFGAVARLMKKYAKVLGISDAAAATAYATSASFRKVSFKALKDTRDKIAGDLKGVLALSREEAENKLGNLRYHRNIINIFLRDWDPAKTGEETALKKAQDALKAAMASMTGKNDIFGIDEGDLDDMSTYNPEKVIKKTLLYWLETGKVEERDEEEGKEEKYISWRKASEKGRNEFDAQRFPDAIKYFEKALEGAPDKKKDPLATNLAKAYLRHLQEHLAFKKKIADKNNEEINTQVRKWRRSLSKLRSLVSKRSMGGDFKSSLDEWKTSKWDDKDLRARNLIGYLDKLSTPVGIVLLKVEALLSKVDSDNPEAKNILANKDEKSTSIALRSEGVERKQYAEKLTKLINGYIRILEDNKDALKDPKRKEIEETIFYAYIIAGILDSSKFEEGIKYYKSIAPLGKDITTDKEAKYLEKYVSLLHRQGVAEYKQAIAAEKKDGSRQKALDNLVKRGSPIRTLRTKFRKHYQIMLKIKKLEAQETKDSSTANEVIKYEKKLNEKNVRTEDSLKTEMRDTLHDLDKTLIALESYEYKHSNRYLELLIDAVERNKQNKDEKNIERFTNLVNPVIENMDTLPLPNKLKALYAWHSMMLKVKMNIKEGEKGKHSIRGGHPDLEKETAILKSLKAEDKGSLEEIRKPVTVKALKLKKKGELSYQKALLIYLLENNDELKLVLFKEPKKFNFRKRYTQIFDSAPKKIPPRVTTATGNGAKRLPSAKRRVKRSKTELTPQVVTKKLKLTNGSFNGKKIRVTKLPKTGSFYVSILTESNKYIPLLEILKDGNTTKIIAVLPKNKQLAQQLEKLFKS